MDQRTAVEQACNQVENQIWGQITTQTYGSVRSQVWKQLLEQIDLSTGRLVMDQAREDTDGSKNT
jgi:hypothetical protein